jgi:transcriptional regulator with XRE-family HTH domain
MAKLTVTILSYNESKRTMTESSEETINRILSRHEIGAKLRKLRLRKKVSLSDLGKHTGLSASMLSQLENGHMIPTLPTLVRIATVFNAGLEHFFGSERGEKLFSVMRGGERMKFPERPGTPAPAFFFECLTLSTQTSGMQAYLAEFPRLAKEEVPEHFHDGSEFVYVLDGEIAIQFLGENHVLAAGDTVYFDSSEPHSYRGLAKHGSRAVVVTMPPRV